MLELLTGYTAERGAAWQYRIDTTAPEPNYYPDAIPVEDVRRRLFHWTPVEAEITATALTPEGVLTVTDPTRKAILRPDTGTILGIFRRGYTPHGYDEWLVRNVEDRLLSGNGLGIGSSGLAKGGAVAWVQVEIPETMTAAGVAYRPWLTAATSLDGSLATTYFTGAQVLACDNALPSAIRHAEGLVKVRHTAGSLGRLDSAADALGLVDRAGEAFRAEVEALNATTVTDAQYGAWVKAYTDPGTSATDRSRKAAEKFAGELWALWRADERVAPWRGTAYGVLAAANTYLHHGGIVRNVHRAERNAERVLRGTTAKADAHALDVLAATLN